MADAPSRTGTPPAGLAASQPYTDAKQYLAERPDILCTDLPDRDGWDKMSEF